MKKCFIILQFGDPFAWMPQFIEVVSKLAPFGWHFMIFSPTKYTDLPRNVHAHAMDIGEFCELVGEKTGIKPNIHIVKGKPNVHVTDFMVAYGKIFEDYLVEFDFWGMCGGPDIVFGRLDHFLPDSYLEDCDIFTDDPYFIDGCFTLCRNTNKVNNLYKKISNWKEAFSQPPCAKCALGIGDHTLYGTDEYGLTEVMKTSKLRYKHPKHYPLHGHDRLERHKISLKEDGSLWELNEDYPPLWSNAIPIFGREILFFHFMKGKVWPL